MSTAPGPTPARDGIDLARGFRFVPEDPDWIKKILFGGLFSLLGLVIVGWFFVGGYFLAVIRRAARGEPRPLPEWDDLGGLFVDGLRATGLYLAHFLGILAIPLALGCLVGVLAGGLGSLGAAHRGSDELAGVLGMGMGLLYMVVALAALVLFLYIPAAMTRFALLGSFSAGFDFRENVAFIRRNLLNYVLALVIYMVASFVAQFAVLLCCIGFFPVSFWAICIFGWALGETARRDPLPVGGRI
jgi:hypothetical protein